MVDDDLYGDAEYINGMILAWKTKEKKFSRVLELKLHQINFVPGNESDEIVKYFADLMELSQTEITCK